MRGQEAAGWANLQLQLPYKDFLTEMPKLRAQLFLMPHLQLILIFFGYHIEFQFI